MFWKTGHLIVFFFWFQYVLKNKKNAISFEKKQKNQKNKKNQKNQKNKKNQRFVGFKQRFPPKWALYVLVFNTFLQKHTRKKRRQTNEKTKKVKQVRQQFEKIENKSENTFEK